MSSAAILAEFLGCAIQQHQAGRCDVAEAAYRQILEIEPLHAEVWHLLGMLCTQTGRYGEAVECISRALGGRSDWVEAHLNLGIAWSGLGKSDEAIACYRRALELKPDCVEALVNLGNCWKNQRKFDDAIACYRRALELRPDLAVVHSNLGNVLQDQGDGNAAVACYRQALALQPDYAEAHNNLGHALRQQKELDEAVAACRRALELKPDFAAAHNNLGNALHDQRMFDKAVACYHRALQLQPGFAEAHHNLGQAFRDQEKLEDAVKCYRRAVELKPDYAEAFNHLGGALKDQGDLDGAVAAFRRALALKPDYVEVLNELGNALFSQGKLDEAVACYRRALELMPGLPAVHSNLGEAFKGQGKLEDAVACHRRALQLMPSLPAVHNNLGEALKNQGRLDEALACYRRALELKPDYASAHSNLLYALQYCTGVTPQDLAEDHAAYDRLHAAPLARAIAPHENSCDRHRRLRVGFVSPDLARHPVGFFLVRVLENLDPERVETTCYSDRRLSDELTRRVRAAATVWREVAGKSDARLAEEIRADRIDVLFDLSGHSGYNRLLVFARKPAPIQITWIGYEGTTGLAAMDCLLADRHVIPEESECFYRERVLRMPDGYLCYDPPAAAPPVGRLPALTTGAVTFGSFNNLAKITPEVIAVWSAILHAAPATRLIMKYRGLGDAAVRQRLLDLFAARGVDPDRLDLRPWSSYADYLTTYHEVDLGLDPFPFSGSTVTCESMWMGVPVVTCPGATFASRHSLTHLSNVGLTGMIARDLREYVELAVSWAGDLPQLAAIRSGLRERMAASPLCDGKRFANNLTSLLQEVWESWCEERTDFHHNAGAVHQALADPAIARCRRALEQRPGDATAHSDLGNVWKDLGQLDDAVACYERALELEPDLALAHNNLAVALSGQGQLEAAISSYRRALDLKPDFVQAHSNLLYTLNFCPGYDARRIYEEHRSWALQHAEPLTKFIQPHANDRSPGRRLRVGYVSPDFCKHPVGLFVLPLLARHDPESFEIFCYSSVARPDEITQRCRTCAQVWRDVAHHTDEQLARSIRDDQIDILVDLTMHMPGNRLLVFARKPAPVQVTWLAYCGTTGLATIDYRLTDPCLDPADRNDRFYSEESIRLPETYWCYPDRGEDPAVGPLPADKAGHVTFGCLNNFCKVTSPTLAAWVRLLGAMPEARLLLHAHTGCHRDRLRDVLTANGVCADRLAFVEYLPTAQYLRAYDRIDIALDPFPLGGGTTTCDALWMGVPVVTLAGDTAAGRSGVSILSNMGLADLVAPDAGAYVQIALELARDRPRLAALRGRLRDRMRTSPLMNAPRFAGHVELAYRTMWHRWCAKGGAECHS